MLWRRSYDVPPPPIDDDDEFSQAGDPRYADLGDEMPRTECLKDVVARLLPYWETEIAADLRAGQTVLVAAHGNCCARSSSTSTASATRTSPASTSRPACRWSTSSTTTSGRSTPGGRYLDPEAAAAAAAAVANQGR